MREENSNKKTHFCRIIKHKSTNLWHPSKHPRYLIVVDEFLQLIGMDDDVQATHLSEAELFSIHARKTHLKRELKVTACCVFLFINSEERLSL